MDCQGDHLPYNGIPAEALDLESQGVLAILCGGET